MQMVIAGACVAGVADISDDVALSHGIAYAETGGVVVEMRVIKDHLLVVAQLVNYLAAESIAPDPDDLAVAGRQHRSSVRDYNIYRAVDPATGTRRVERVMQIARTPAFDRNNQIDWFHAPRRGSGRRFRRQRGGRCRRWFCPCPGERRRRRFCR